jgi:lipopolysaccharide transport system ATP-binding protein
VAVHVKVDDLTLKVPLFVQSDRPVRSWGALLLNALFDPPKREFRTLLDGVSFEVAEGERVAILGRNGAGKSTLLRCLNGVYQPTRGSVAVAGTCQALLNTSLGFNGEATVKENVFLRANAMQLDSRRFGDLLGPILEFAGLSEKANHRLKTLSAGQKMRLGFAISTELQHDIMLLDEWIGAGDSEFLKRAKQRMLERMGGSKIVMLASHNFSLLKDVCNKGMVLEGGRIVYFGPLVEAFKAYQVVAAMPPPAAGSRVEMGRGETLAAGCVDEIRFEGEYLHVRGWAINDTGTMPAMLQIVTAFGSWVFDEYQKFPRPDVRSHVGAFGDLLGYELRLKVPGVEGLEGLGGVLQVYGGATEDTLVGPFRMDVKAVNALVA